MWVLPIHRLPRDIPNHCCQDLGVRRNINSVLGCNPLLWCWPRPPIGSGLRYELSKKDGEWYDLACYPNGSSGDASRLA